MSAPRFILQFQIQLVDHEQDDHGHEQLDKAEHEFAASVFAPRTSDERMDTKSIRWFPKDWDYSNLAWRSWRYEKKNHHRQRRQKLLHLTHDIIEAFDANENNQSVKSTATKFLQYVLNSFYNLGHA